MKKILALLLALTMMVSTLAACGDSGSKDTQSPSGNNNQTTAPTEDNSGGGDALEVLTQFGDLSADDAEYDPNPAYDKYTVIEYYIEDADATVIATVSAKADESEYYLEYAFYGDDQLVVCDHNGNVSQDKTGFMAGSTPDMIKYIQENAVWSAIPG